MLYMRTDVYVYRDIFTKISGCYGRAKVKRGLLHICCHVFVRIARARVCTY